MKKHDRLRNLLWILGLAVVYFLTGKFALSLSAANPSVSLFWPPAGIAFSSLLLFGSRLWPGVFLGAFFVNLSTTGVFATSLAIALGNTMEAVAGVFLIQRFGYGKHSFDSTKGVWLFVGLVCGIGTAISATIGTLSLTVGGLSYWSDFGLNWLNWWLGDAVGALIVAPAWILWSNQPNIEWTQGRLRESALFLLAVALMGTLVFGDFFSIVLKNYPIAFFAIPILLWSATRFPMREAATHQLLFCVLAIWGTMRGDGPFALVSREESLVLLQIFLCIASVFSLLVGSLIHEQTLLRKSLQHSNEELERTVEERTQELRLSNAELLEEIRKRRSAESELQASEGQLRAVVESANDGVISADRGGRIISWNRAAERIFGYSVSEARGALLTLLMPERFHQPHLQGFAQFLRTQESTMIGKTTDLWGRRKSGEEFPMELSLSTWELQGEIFFTGIVRDISRRKKLEEERRSAQVLQRQIEELSQRTVELSLINDLGDSLRAVTTLAEMHSVIKSLFEQLFPDDSGALYLFEPQYGLFQSMVKWGRVLPAEEVFMPKECWSVRTSAPHYVRRSSTEKICPHRKPEEEFDSLCVPLFAQGGLLGLLCLLGTEKDWETNTGENGHRKYKIELVEAAAKQVSSALMALRLQERLMYQASRCAVTGLFNRHYLEETLPRPLLRAARHRSRVALLMADLDHFKKINDRYGHGGGDFVLRQVANFLQEQSRGEDLICRYGGEEFIVVMVDCSLKDAVRRADQIRVGVKKLALSYQQQDLAPVTISIGIALFPEHGRDTKSLIEAADQALYAAKGDGRDKIKVAQIPRFRKGLESTEGA